MKRLSCFTLAEILVTLGIIGIVAAITIPTLMNKTQDQEYKTAYKKAFSVASQAWYQAVGDSNIESRTGWYDGNAKLDNFKAFKSYFKVIKDCNSGSNNTDCWAVGEYFYTAYPDNSAFSFIDNSGMSWSILSTSNTGSGSEILVDTNGLKGPNKYGQDRFMLISVTGDGKTATAGIPIKIIPYDHGDVTNYDANLCQSGNTHPCYYKTWLMN